jgi:hypothetical protein
MQIIENSELIKNIKVFPDMTKRKQRSGGASFFKLQGQSRPGSFGMLRP